MSRKWKWMMAAAAVAVLVVAPMWLVNAYGLGIESDHSRFASSASLADAKARGVFVRHVAVTDSAVPWGSRTLIVRDAWIEERTQVMYTLALPWTRRVERLGTYRLMLSLAAADGDSIHSDERWALVSTICVVLPGDRVMGVGTAMGTDAPFRVDVQGTPPARIAVAASSTRCAPR